MFRECGWELLVLFSKISPKEKKNDKKITFDSPFHQNNNSSLSDNIDDLVDRLLSKKRISFFATEESNRKPAEKTQNTFLIKDFIKTSDSLTFKKYLSIFLTFIVLFAAFGSASFVGDSYINNLNMTAAQNDTSQEIVTMSNTTVSGENNNNDTNNEPPVITDDSGDVSAGTGDSVILWVTSMDNIGVTSAEVFIDDGGAVNMTWDAGDSRWEYVYTASSNDDGDHTYTVTVYDAESLSNSSNSYAITVTDNDPPEITNVTEHPSLQNSSSGWVNIICDVTDNIEVDSVKINITWPEGFEPQNITMNEGSYYYNATYTRVGTYTYFIWANDTSGNENTSDIHNFWLCEEINVTEDVEDIVNETNISGQEYINITASEAKKMIDSNQSIIILDVRDTEEYDSGHIEGALSIPFMDLGCDSCLQNMLDEHKNESIIVYCNSSVNSKQACEILVENGYIDLYNLEGGITAWIDAGFSITNPFDETPLSPRIDEILGENRSVFLFFYTDTCGYCQDQKPVLDELSENYSEKIEFIYINKADNPEAFNDFDVTSYPTMFLVVDKDEQGYTYKDFSGFNDKNILINYFDMVLDKNNYSSVFDSWWHGTISLHRALGLPLEVAAKISHGEDAQVIIQYKGESNFSEEVDYLESIGFVKTAEISSKRFVAGILNSSVYEGIKFDNDILAVYSDENFTVLLNESLPLIRYDEAVEEFNVTGNGMKICILDTGVNSSLVNYSYGYDFVNDDSVPDDEHGHGTKVASVIKSIAPDAELIVAKVIGGSGVGYESTVLEALEWCIAQDPDVISFSIGSQGSCSGFCDTNFVASMSNDAVDSGIFVVAASGNDGTKNLTSPACGSKVFSVGATDDNDSIAGFSSVNPTLDMFAPGVNIDTIAGSGSGTSYSAPHVSGASLLVLENELLNPVDLKYRLRSTGKPINYTYNETISLSIPRLDVYNALANNVTMVPYDYSWWWQGVLIDGEIYEPLDTLDLLPNAPDAPVQQWDSTNGQDPPTHYTEVDDPIGSHDDDDTYVYTGTNNEVEDFNHETSALLTGATITNVRLTIRARKINSLSPVTVNLGLRIGIKRYPGISPLDLTTSYVNYSYNWLDNPADSQPWEKSDIDSLQSSLLSEIGVVNPTQIRCTQVYLTVTYEPANTAPAIKTWNADTEPGATSGWDWDNNDLQVDWEVGDDDRDTLTLLWTFSLGGTPDDPTIESYNGRKTGIELGSYTMNNQDLDWTSGTWEDYRGTVNFKFRLHDGTEYSATIVADSLTGGIDGTDPGTTIMNYPNSNDGPDSIWGNASDETCYVDHVDMYIKNTTDSTYWTGSTWSTETWLSASANDSSFNSADEDWSYDSSGITWGYKSYEIKANTSDESGRDDSSPATDTFTITDDVSPSINFTEPPTPQNNTETTDTYALVNVTVSDNLGDVSSFIDWNQSLRGYWSMDYTNSTHVFDNSSYGNNASFNGGLSQSDITTGIYGDALEFDGNDDNLSVLDHSSLDITDEITIEAWVKDPPLTPSNNAHENEDNTPGIINEVNDLEEENRPGIPYGFIPAGTYLDTSSSNLNDHRGDSFGIKNVKAVNSSHFWNDFYLPHSTWQLEVQHPVTLEWLDEWEGTNLNTWLDIDRNRSEDNSSEKTTLNITNNHPTQALKFRLKFDIDAQVKNYVNRSSWYEYELTYTANKTENYTVFFNYSDLKPLIQNETLFAQHGIKNIDGKDVFWFMLTVNQTLGAGNTLSIDPTFGYSTGSLSVLLFEASNEDVLGHYATMGAIAGDADKITVKFGAINTNINVWCALYEYTDYDTDYVGNLVANGATDIVAVGAGDANSEVDFPFSGTKPSLSANTDYYMMIAVSQNYIGLFGNVYVLHDTTGDDHAVRDLDRFITTWPSPFTGESALVTDLWMYCTYTETAPSNNAPTQSNPGPANESTEQPLTPALNVTCTDADGDTMNATWWSNSSGTWQQFATNNTISNNSNIIQTNSNFSNYSSTYWWSVNLTDGNGGWNNATYHFTTRPAPKTILAKGNAYELSINGTSPMILYGYLDDTLIVNTSIDENWHHVAFTYDGTTANLYVDGNLNDTNYTYSDPITTNDNNLEIGSNLTGELDEIRLWSRALTWEEINASYNASSINTYEHNFSGLAVNNYSYYAYAIDAAGNHNSTETRYFNVTVSTDTSISVTPESWNQGSVSIGSSNETTSFNFTLTNNGNVIIDVQITASNATNSTDVIKWLLASSASPDNFSIQYNRSDIGTWTNINTTYDTFLTNLGIDASQTFDLKLIMATTSSTTDSLSFDITLKSVAS